MKLRRRSSRLPRAPWPNGIERTEPLRGQLWTRSEKALKPPDVHWAWRLLAVAAAGLEIALLVWLWFGPAFALRSVQVSEWDPVAAYHAGPSTKLFLLSSQAVVLGPTPTSGGLVDIQGPAVGDPRVGERALDPVLLTALINIQRGFPTLLGQDVAGFVFDSCGNLTLVAKRGWKVYFGRVLTPEEFASLRDKLAALKAIAGNGNVNYASSDLLYVNVMNPSEPAVGYKSRQPAPPSPSPGATPAPAPSPSPCK